MDAERSKMSCQIPPPGWYCTRAEGHDGPCAALPNLSNQTISPFGVGYGGESITVIAQHLPTLCANCGKGKGTEIWCEGTIAYVHGMYVMWCKRCVCVKQLAYAQERAAAIPELERLLKELDSQSPVDL